jgi:anti-sigma regulatory factor (Ser/Thr protein kinase)
VIIGGWRGPGWRVVDADPGRGKQVRDWISAAVARHGCPVDPADAALAVAELFANAIMHGPPRGRVLVGYCLWSRGARIAVCDGGGPSTPRLGHSTSLAEGGRGLQVVDSVAARWGTFRLPGARIVWCDFGQPLRAPAIDAWAWLCPVLSATILSAPAATSGQPLETGPAGPGEAAGLGVNAPVPVHLMTARPAPSGPGGDRARLLAADAPAAIPGAALVTPSARATGT